MQPSLWKQGIMSCTYRTSWFRKFRTSVPLQASIKPFKYYHPFVFLPGRLSAISLKLFHPFFVSRYLGPKSFFEQENYATFFFFSRLVSYFVYMCLLIGLLQVGFLSPSLWDFARIIWFLFWNKVWPPIFFSPIFLQFWKFVEIPVDVSFFPPSSKIPDGDGICAWLRVGAGRTVNQTWSTWLIASKKAHSRLGPSKIYLVLPQKISVLDFDDNFTLRPDFIF